ncbi:hypothetical protein K7432_005856 [Basidiobolus ranarum]|uniref:G-protein coupled receptors family 2 profile 2 domain-containing protein n=1 Tax=Basidiobolus ranarum TaxID=34480 RepID=A0ABR2W2I5_9FUNG
MSSYEELGLAIDGIRNHTLRASFVIGLISVIAVIIVIVVGVIIQWYYRHESTRTSFTLALWVALWDLGFHIGNILSATLIKHDISSSNLLCTLLRFFGNMFKLLSIFTTAIIAFNLHQVFVLKKERFAPYQIYYIPVVMILALAISVPCLISSRIQGVCWLADPNNGYRLLMAWWGSGYIWMIGCMAYSVGVVVSVLRILKRHQRQMSREDTNNSGFSKSVRRSVFRIAMYPVIPVITFSFAIAGNTLEFIRMGSDSDSIPLLIISSSFIIISDFATSATGVLTAVIFCMDPMLQRFIHSIRASSVSYYHCYSKTNSVTTSMKCRIIYWCCKEDINRYLRSDEYSTTYYGKPSTAFDEFPETHIMLSSMEIIAQEAKGETESPPNKQTRLEKNIQYL